MPERSTGLRVEPGAFPAPGSLLNHIGRKSCFQRWFEKLWQKSLIRKVNRIPPFRRYGIEADGIDRSRRVFLPVVDLQEPLCSLTRP